MRQDGVEDLAEDDGPEWCHLGGVVPRVWGRLAKFIK